MSPVQRGVKISSVLDAFTLKIVVDDLCGSVCMAKFRKIDHVLIETFYFQQAKKLLKTTSILNGDVPAKIELASPLDTIRGFDFWKVPEKDIVSNLTSQRVLKCKCLTKDREKTRRNFYFSLLDGNLFLIDYFVGILVILFSCNSSNLLMCFNFQLYELS